MQSNLNAHLAAAHVDQMRRAAAEADRSGCGRSGSASVGANVVIRPATEADLDDLAALAILDDALPPAGDALVAEVDGSPRAVLPLAGGRPFADPFRPTADLVQLLQMRAEQLSPGSTRRGHLFGVPALLRRAA